MKCSRKLANFLRGVHVVYKIFIGAIFSNKGDKKATILLNLTDPKAIERETSFNYSPAESSDDPECLWPCYNIILEIYRFNAWIQRPGKSVQIFGQFLVSKKWVIMTTMVTTMEKGQLTRTRVPLWVLGFPIMPEITIADLRAPLCLEWERLEVEASCHCQTAWEDWVVIRWSL